MRGPPNPPDRGPPLDRAPPDAGFAMLTISFRPSNGWLWSCLMAACASASVDISTKPNPRDCPDIRSVTTVADSTVPHWEKYSCRLAEVVEKDRPPTYNLDAMERLLGPDGAGAHQIHPHARHAP